MALLREATAQTPADAFQQLRIPLLLPAGRARRVLPPRPPSGAGDRLARPRFTVLLWLVEYLRPAAHRPQHNGQLPPRPRTAACGRFGSMVAPARYRGERRG